MRVLIAENLIMWLSRLLIVTPGLASLLTGVITLAAEAGIGCPPTHDGHPLVSLGLFEGPPAERVEIRPQPGRYIVPQKPEYWTGTFPNFTLGCKYQGADGLVTIILPRHIRVCEFTDDPQVVCR